MNYRINKRRKNNSQKKKSSKDILLPSLNSKIYSDKISKPNSNISSGVPNPKNNYEKLENINKTKIPEKNKTIKPNIFIKNSNNKPFSGNPSNKPINNILNLKILKRNNMPNSYERDILTANPSLIGNKASFRNYKENNNINSNVRYDDKGLIINEANYKENIEENINYKYQYYKEKSKKMYKKMGFGVSKSSPRISSIKIISNPFENQKQKEVAELPNNLKILFSYADYVNYYKNSNALKIKNISNVNPDSRSFKEHNNSLMKEKSVNYNLPNVLGASLVKNSEAQNIIIKAVGKLNSNIIKKHSNLKSANLNNQLSENFTKNKLGKNMLKNFSKNSLNNSLKDAKNNNNSLIKQNEEKILLKPKSKCFISYAYIDYPNLEHRQEMEDFHCIKQALGKRPNLSYFAIFDGHGGKDVASYLSINLHHFLVNEINNINFGVNDEENINNIMESIKLAFNKIDQEILSNINFVNDVGSTATLIFIYYNTLNIKENEKENNADTNNEISNIERTIICANVGDSSGYLINKLNIKQITKPHKCEDQSEVKRIKDNGGIVFQGRIFGKLILTRTLGDKEMKKYGVLSLPDFYVKKIDKDDLFVVIGSDGIWDVINEEELFKMGNEKELSSESFSKKIMAIAKERDTRDNSSCIVIKLNKNI